MTRDVRNICAAFDLLAVACEQIKDNDRCEECPMHHTCLEDYNTSVIEYADLMSGEAWQEFINFADTCLPSEELQRDMVENSMYDSYRDMQYDNALDEMDRNER